MPSPTLTRRALFAGAGTIVASAALSIPYVSAAHSKEVCALPLDPKARFDAAAAEFMAAAEALCPGLTDWTINVTDTAVLAFACREATFAGPGVYEVEMRDFKGQAIRPIVALAAAESQDGYWWQSYWTSTTSALAQSTYRANLNCASSAKSNHSPERTARVSDCSASRASHNLPLEVHHGCQEEYHRARQGHNPA